MRGNTIERMGWREKFALARKAKGVTQDQLCEMTGYGQNTLSALESVGAPLPKLKTLLESAEKLDIDVSWLFSNTPDHIPSDAEKAARIVFEAKLAAIGPVKMMDLLVTDPSSTPRPVGDYSLGEIVGMAPTASLPALPDRKKKRTDTPNSPTGQL